MRLRQIPIKIDRITLICGRWIEYVAEPGAEGMTPDTQSIDDLIELLTEARNGEEINFLTGD